MIFLKTLARAAGLGLCVAALSGTALADPGNGNGNGPATTPPGQEQKAETPASAPAPQAARGQAQKAENQAKQAAKKAAPKPTASSKPKSTAAKAAAPGQAKKAEHKQQKTSSSYKNTSSGTDLKNGMAHKHTICHATGSESNPFVVITPSVSGVFNGHLGHQGDEDIVPPFVYKGTTYSQNWDAAGQALFANGCAAPASSTPLTPVTPSSTQTTSCPTTITTTEQVLVGIKHYTGAVKNGERKYVVISPSEKSAHMNGKHADDVAIYETRTVTRTVSGENCAAVNVTSSGNTTNTRSTQTSVTSQSTQSSQVSQSTAAGGQAPVGGVAGAVSPAPAAEKAKAAEKPAGGVLGAIASAPEAVAETATTGTLPFTGIPLWIAALIGGALLATGLVLRRAS